MDSRAFMRRLFEPAIRRAGIVGATWHTLRHTAASRRALNGVDLYRIKEILGHRDIATTQRYAHLTPGFLRDAVNRGSLFALSKDSQTKAGEIQTKEGTGSNRPTDTKSFAQPLDMMVRLTGFEPVALSSGG